MHVPVAPLQWDTTINVGHTSVHTVAKREGGFEVVDVSNNEITINSVSISGANQITIVCATPPGAGSRLRYAMAGDGPTTQRKGQLCDSDPFIGVDSQTLSCTVTNGSNTVVYSGTLNHGKRDIVSGSGFAANTIITWHLWHDAHAFESLDGEQRNRVPRFPFRPTQLPRRFRPSNELPATDEQLSPAVRLAIKDAVNDAIKEVVKHAVKRPCAKKPCSSRKQPSIMGFKSKSSGVAPE